MQCSFDGCEKEVHSKKGKYAGLCISHKAQLSKTGVLKPLRPTRARPNQPSTEERFLSLVEKTEGCWNWIGSSVGGGYGSFSNKGKTNRAHRVAYELWVGELGENSVVHHTCAVRSCVNPAHLQLVTPQENSAEMLERNAYIARIEELEAEIKQLRSKRRGWLRRG